MNELPNLDWVPFFEELADRLLEFKNDRDLLLKKLINVFDNIDSLSFPLNGQEEVDSDIDPFTVFSFINRQISGENRNRLCEEIKEEFNLLSPVPSEFDAVPRANNMKTYFTLGEPEDIENLWNLFEAALAYSSSSSEENKSKFIKFYDQAQTQNGIRWNITMGLFWIRPYSYIALDKLNRGFTNNNPEFAQVILRWLTQRGIVAMPKSVHKHRMEENFNIFDFKLNQEDMNLIATLDQNESLFFSHRDPSIIKALSSRKLDI